MLDKWLLVLLIVGCTALVFLVCFPIDFYMYRRRKKLSRDRKHLFMYRPQNAVRAAQYHAQVSVDTFTGNYIECSDDERVDDKKREKKNSFARLMNLFQKKKAAEQAQQQKFKLENVVTAYQRMAGYQRACAMSETGCSTSSYSEDIPDVTDDATSKSRKTSTHVLLKSHRILESTDTNDGYGTTRQTTSDVQEMTGCSGNEANVTQNGDIESEVSGRPNDAIEFVNYHTKPANYGSLDNVNIAGDKDTNTPEKHIETSRELFQGQGTTERVQAYISRDVNSSDSESENETDNEASSDNDVTHYNADSDTNIRMRNRVNIEEQIHHAYSEQNMAATTRRPKHVTLMGRKRNSVGPADNVYCLPARNSSQHDSETSYTSNRSMSSPLIPQNIIQRTMTPDTGEKKKREKTLPKDTFRSMPYIPNEVDLFPPIDCDQ